MFLDATAKQTEQVPPDLPIRLTKVRQEQYLNLLQDSGRKAQTIRAYRRGIESLRDFLGEDGEITRESLALWRDRLKESGYSEHTVNQRLSAVNGFLRFCGEKELAVPHERIEAEESEPEMTRAEYLRFLSDVRKIGAEKEYFLIKIFGSVDINIGELEYLTLEACREGIIRFPDGRQSVIPSCLQEELLDYAAKNQITGGPLFVTKSGQPIDRSNITNSIRRLAVQAGVAPEACCPRALHRLYLTTQRELTEQLRPIYLQSYNHLLDTEQAVVGWRRE